MAQPVGIFVGLSQVDLSALRASALARIGGQVTSVSEAGGGYTKSIGMDPADVLREVQYAEGAARGTLAARQTRPNFGSLSGVGYPDARADIL